MHNRDQLVREYRTTVRWLLRLAQVCLALAGFFLLVALVSAVARRPWEQVLEQLGHVAFNLVMWRVLRLEAFDSADAAVAVDSGMTRPDLSTRIRSLLAITDDDTGKNS